MEFSLEKINERNDPYQLFLDFVKNEDTSRRYKNSMREESFVTKQVTVMIEEPTKSKETGNPTLNFILPAVVIVGSVVVLGKKGYIPFKNKKPVK